MSANRYANAGPIMAAMFGGVERHNAFIAKAMTRSGDGGTVFSVSNDDLVRMIENLADQVANLAAQMVDVRQQLKARDRLVAAAEAVIGSAFEQEYGTSHSVDSDAIRDLGMALYG